MSGWQAPGIEESGRIILGIDPGLASVGFGVVKEVSGRLYHVDHGTIQTSPSQPSAERLFAIYSGILALIDTYGPSAGGIEGLFFFRNVSSALPVAEACGVIKLAFRQRSIDLSEFSPNDIKKAVSGTARAEKQQVQEMVKMLLGLSDIPKPDHAADALAAAICRAHFEGPSGLAIT